ncbi:MAG: YaiO family outer membrane beta-barrel protein [Terriglobales bacterium]
MKKAFFFLAFLLPCALAAQNSSNTTVAPGTSLPGLGGLSMAFEGPGYIEIGGSHSSLTDGYNDWNDFYMRGMVSGGHNAFIGEISRQGRFGSSGWLGGLGLTRTLSESWYAQFSASSSIGGFFLNRYSFDGLINRKLLTRRQLVMTAGMGYDQSKTVDHDLRGQIGAAYYFQYPIVLQGGMMWTEANPGNVLARTQFIAATQGYDKEHFISLRYDWGREGYEVVGIGPGPGANSLFNFHQHTITGTWRQWIGPRWGLNFIVEQHQEPAYHRIGGTAGVFIDF